MSAVERFLGAGRMMSDRNNLPTTGRRQERFPAVRKIVLGRMVAQVAIIPMPVAQISLIGYDGDAEMMSALRGSIEGGVLRLNGEIPFKPGSANNAFGRTSGIFVGGNVVIGGSSFSSSSGGGDTIILDGREVDLGRSIRFGLVVPQDVDVKIGGLIGAIGITDHLDGELDFSPSVRAELVARSVESLVGDLNGSGKATVGAVTGDADMEVSGSGSFQVGSVSGKVDAQVSGSGDISVGGGASHKLRASVSGSGMIHHNGVVTGDARLSVSGSGEVTAATVRGEVDRSVSGSGYIRANGKTYRKRDLW